MADKVELSEIAASFCAIRSSASSELVGTFNHAFSKSGSIR